MKPELKAELIRKLEALEGITDDERAALLGLLRTNRTYGLVWEDKPEDIEETLREQLPVLREVKDKAIIAAENHTETQNTPPVNSLIPNHLIIEGDNLVSLSALAYTHAGKIDVIYIDPPYNTGNKDFVYNDDVVDSEDSYKHSKWIAFMKRRLEIARKLLKPSGFIFISIDFHEMPNLLLLCNEVFKESNYVGNVSVKGNPRGRQSSSYFAQVDDGLVVYRKSNESVLQGLLIDEELAKKRFNKIDKQGKCYEEWELRKRGADSKRIDSPNLWFPIYYNELTEEISLEQISAADICVLPKLSTGEDGRWRWSKAKVEKYRSSLYVRKTRSGYNVFERKYPESKSRQLAPTIWDYPYVNTELGTKLLKEVLGNDVAFDYPKPIGLMTTIFSLYPNNSATILDFFAGSGTTLHAVMQLNAEDGGHRQCILCTNNENGICENVTYERNKRVIRGYTKPNGEKVEGLHDNNLRYYRTEFISRSRTPRNMQRLVELATDMLCIKEDLYAEQPEMGGMRVVPRVFRYFAEGERKMLIIYREEYIEEIVRLIAKVETTAPIRVYVFSPCEDPSSELFEPVAEKVEPVALPAAIYNTYKRILPKRRDRRVDTAADNAAGVAADTEPDNELGGLFETQDQA